MGGSCNELQDLTNRLVARARAYGMEVSTEKCKVMVNSTKEISVNITVNGQPLEVVTGFKYSGATLSKDGTCRAEIRIWMATAMAVMAMVNRMWKSNMSFQTKLQLFWSLVVSILLYNLNITRVCSCTGSLAMRPPEYIPNLHTHTPSRYSNSRNYQLSLPRPRIDIFKTSISFFGAYLWNNLPLTVRSCQSLSSFKRKLRAHLEVVT